MPDLILPRVNDFDPADHAVWSALAAHPIHSIRGRPGQPATFKAAYSPAGLYVRFDCVDARVVTTGLSDQADLWTEDVVESFFWPDQAHPLYVEHELSPFGSELLLLVPNRRGKFMGWSPWHFEGERKTHKVAWRTPGGWGGAYYLPFTLFTGIADVPTPGTTWRANFCRIDHDGGKPRLYSWSPGLDATFHDPSKFGKVRFE